MCALSFVIRTIEDDCCIEVESGQLVSPLKKPTNQGLVQHMNFQRVPIVLSIHFYLYLDKINFSGHQPYFSVLDILSLWEICTVSLVDYYFWQLLHSQLMPTSLGKMHSSSVTINYSYSSFKNVVSIYL